MIGYRISLAPFAVRGDGWKYIKPLSVAWWSAFVPLVLGLLIATEPLHQLVAMAETASLLTGGADPYLLINGGMFGIGLRGRHQPGDVPPVDPEEAA